MFDDIETLARQCQFSDCQHDTEPGCAVQQAVEDNRLDGRRLLNYKKLLRENAVANASLAEKRAQDRGFAKVVKQGKKIKQMKGEH